MGSPPLPKRMKPTMNIFLLLFVLIFSGGCDKDKVGAVSPDPIVVKDTTLQSIMPFKFGCAVSINLLKNRTVYRDLVLKEFNSLTAESAMKFSQLHPAENTYSWDNADYLVDFALQNNKRVHGHTLVWYRSIPDWVLNYQGDTEAWDKLLKNHIQTVVSRYKGKISSWDVVNEALTDDGKLRDCIWLQKLGPEYIDKSFIYAHEADPNALLFYNDYGHEYSATKRSAINLLIANLLQKGVPIHGIGLQMHTTVNQSNANLEAAINTAASTGLKVHIAELDIALNPNNDKNLTYSDDLATKQSAKYKFIVNTYNGIPRNQQFGITTWNVSDADTWITSNYNRPDWPLPFDSNYQRKAAYIGIIEAVR